MKLKAYEQGYFDGLCEAHADWIPPSRTRATRRLPLKLYTHPAYREGFRTGLKDGAEVLMALGKTARPRQKEFARNPSLAV